MYFDNRVSSKHVINLKCESFTHRYLKKQYTTITWSHAFIPSTQDLTLSMHAKWHWSSRTAAVLVVMYGSLGVSIGRLHASPPPPDPLPYSSCAATSACANTVATRNSIAVMSCRRLISCFVLQLLLDGCFSSQ